MKKMLYSLLRWPCLLQDSAQQTFTVQNKPTLSSTKISYPFFVSGIGRKTVDAIKFVAAQKMLLKQKPSKHS